MPLLVECNLFFLLMVHFLKEHLWRLVRLVIHLATDHKNLEDASNDVGDGLHRVAGAKLDIKLNRYSGYPLLGCHLIVVERFACPNDSRSLVVLSLWQAGPR